MGQKQRSIVSQGRFGAQQRATYRSKSRAHSRSKWSSHALLWGGAIIVGLTVGLAPSLSSGTAESGWPTGSIHWNEVQGPPQAYATPADKARAIRGSTAELTSSPQEIGPSKAATRIQGLRASFSFCHSGGGHNCVVDGDTIWLEGRKVRLADIDAPETHEPRCPGEKILGGQATRRLQQLLNSGSVSLGAYDRDEDRYGRKLRIVLVDGVSAGDTLVSEGLARHYASGRRSWC